ncbi:MAG: L-2-amino-thiazoline-4-carboxylic acid hydrolase [Coriobacteriia bacterium]|nr:L-2-amino-thiazoline-4-carboxylic acid hydrolase [Coriobacteriia bacterium]
MEQSARTIEELEAELAKSRAETRSAFETRAYMYAYIYEELVTTIGKDAAIALMKRAIYRRGIEVGRKYRPAVEAADLVEVGSIFCNGSPCQGELFEPGIEENSNGHIVLRMTSCPLHAAWEGMGLPAEEVDTLCEIAAAVDEGTFAGAGLDLTFLSRLGAGADKCLLDLQLPADE